MKSAAPHRAASATAPHRIPVEPINLSILIGASQQRIDERRERAAAARDDQHGEQEQEDHDKRHEPQLLLAHSDVQDVGEEHAHPAGPGWMTGVGNALRSGFVFAHCRLAHTTKNPGKYRPWRCNASRARSSYFFSSRSSWSSAGSGLNRLMLVAS